MSNPSVALYFQIRGSKNHKLQIANKVVIELPKTLDRAKRLIKLRGNRLSLKKTLRGSATKLQKSLTCPLAISHLFFAVSYDTMTWFAVNEFLSTNHEAILH